MPDIPYLKMIFYYETGKRLDINNPCTFNEKLQWLKIYDKNPLYNMFVDKYEVREHISKTIGSEYLIPLYGIWDKVDEIDFNKLPESFALKCTHGSTSNIICRSKENLSIIDAKESLNKWLRKNWYWFGREWPYKDVRPRIMAEKYMTDETDAELMDYKIFCFNGVPKIIQVHFNRHSNHKANFYDTDWNYVPISTRYQPDPKTVINKPEHFDDMLSLASKLSLGLPYIRVDFYSIFNKLYFGELTLYPASGFGVISPEEWDRTFGNWVDTRLAYSKKTKSRINKVQ